MRRVIIGSRLAVSNRLDRLARAAIDADAYFFGRLQQCRPMGDAVVQWFRSENKINKRRKLIRRA